MLVALLEYLIAILRMVLRVCVASLQIAKFSHREREKYAFDVSNPCTEWCR